MGSVSYLVAYPPNFPSLLCYVVDVVGGLGGDAALPPCSRHGDLSSAAINFIAKFSSSKCGAEFFSTRSTPVHMSASRIAEKRSKMTCITKTKAWMAVLHPVPMNIMASMTEMDTS